MADVILAITSEFRRYKALADAAFAQLEDAELLQPGPNGGNSIAVLVSHVAGNLASRFTEFRSSDGEKPWRRRDEEFEPRRESRSELLDRWEGGWRALFDALSELTDADLGGTVTVRGEPLQIDQALLRSVAHTAYHVGQMLFLAKSIKGKAWKYLSIPPGGSEAYNRAPAFERASAHAAALAGGAWRGEPIAIADAEMGSDEARALTGELDAELRARYPEHPEGAPPHTLRAEDADAHTVFLIAREHGRGIACGASRRLADGSIEIKRMYVRPSHRGRGLGRRILAELESRARAAGASRLVLETGLRQPEAIALYRSSGFSRIDPFGEYVGDAMSRCFEKRL